MHCICGVEKYPLLLYKLLLYKVDIKEKERKMVKSEIKAMKVKQRLTPLFLSSGLQSDKEKRIYYKIRAWAGKEGFSPIDTIGISVPPPKPEDISKVEQEYISKSECFIAIVGARWNINGFAHSYSVHDEISIAKAQNKPVYLFLEKGVRGEGGIKYKADKRFTFESWQIEVPEEEYRFREELRGIKEEICHRASRCESVCGWRL